MPVAERSTPTSTRGGSDNCTSTDFLCAVFFFLVRYSMVQQYLRLAPLELFPFSQRSMDNLLVGLVALAALTKDSAMAVVNKLQTRILHTVTKKFKMWTRNAE